MKLWPDLWGDYFTFSEDFECMLLNLKFHYRTKRATSGIQRTIQQSDLLTQEYKWGLQLKRQKEQKRVTAHFWMADFDWLVIHLSSSHGTRTTNINRLSHNGITWKFRPQHIAISWRAWKRLSVRVSQMNGFDKEPNAEISPSEADKTVYSSKVSMIDWTGDVRYKHTYT